MNIKYLLTFSLVLILFINIFAVAQNKQKAQNYVLQNKIENNSDIYAFACNSNIFLTGDLAGNIKLWNMKSKELLTTLGKHKEWVNSIDISPYGKFAASGGSDNNLQIFDLENRKALNSFSNFTEQIFSLEFLSDSTILVATDKLYLMNIFSRNILKKFSELSKKITKVKLFPNKKFAAVGSSSGLIYIVDLKSFKSTSTLKKHKKDITALAISNDNRTIASGSKDSLLVVWENLKPKLLSKAHNEEVCSIVISEDGNYMFSGGWDRNIIITNIKTGKIEQRITDHHNTVSSVNLFENVLISISFDGTIRFWSRK